MTSPTPAAHYTGMTIDLLQERVAKLEAEKTQLVEAATALLPHRVGDLPNLGYLRDTNASRKALANLVAALAAVQSREAA